MLNTCVLSKHQKHNKCLRDTSGILFRLHAMVEDGEVQIGERHRFPLQDADESVLALFEGERAKSYSIDGHFVGDVHAGNHGIPFCIAQCHQHHSSLFPRPLHWTDELLWLFWLLW